MSQGAGGQSSAVGLPEDPELWLFEGFESINSKPSRSAIADKEMFWCKNFMPLGENNLHALTSNGAPIYTAGTGRTVVCFDFFVLNSTAYCIVFLDDGSADIVNVGSSSVVNSFAASTFSGTPRTTQWGNQYLLIVTTQTNGYYVWDGTSFYSTGSLGPIVQLDNVGNGYTSAPTVTAFGGSGSGATFSAQIVGNQVVQVNVTNPGSGYTVNDVVALSFTGGGSGGTTAELSSVITNGAVTFVNVVSPGSGYTSSATVQFEGGGGAGAEAIPVLTGQVGSITITNGGANYTSAPSVVIAGAGSTGSGAAAVATIEDNGQVTQVTMTSYGSGYVSPVGVAFTGGGSGSGFVMAQGQANIINGTVTDISMTNGGNGYVTAPTAYLLDALSPVTQAHLTPMPFGISGTDITTFTSRAWIINGNKCYFTSPDNPSDFYVGNGAGAFLSTDAFLVNAFIAVVSANGFLYFIGDSSVNSVSGVTTSGDPLLTTFTNLNIDPQIGTIWHDSVRVYARAVMLANPYGIHALYGGAVQKVSTPMDGLFDISGGLTNPGFALSSAIAEVFGVHVYMLLAPITDILTGATTNHLVMWDGKRWWLATQTLGLTFINYQENNSQLTAYGTDGSNVFPLFQAFTTATTKSVQSKLWTKPTYMMNKRLTRFTGLYQNNTNETLTVDVSLDIGSGVFGFNYQQSFPYVAGAIQSQVQNCDQVGVGLGFTLKSNNQNFVLISFSALGQKYAWET